MRIISVSNYKGGVGKTTTATNLAFNLSSIGFKVLLVDADPQGNTSYFYSIYDLNKMCLSDVLSKNCSIKESIVQTKYKNLDLLPSNQKLDGLVEDKDGVPLIGNELGDYLKIVNDKYDFCVIDCQPSFQLNTIAALACSQDVIIPLKLGRFSINGLELMSEMIEHIHEINEDISYKVLITMFRKNISANRNALMELVDEYNYPLYETGIRLSVAVDECENNKKPLSKGRKTSTACEDYKKFTIEYLTNFFNEDNWSEYITEESRELSEDLRSKLV